MTLRGFVYIFLHLLSGFIAVTLGFYEGYKTGYESAVDSMKVICEVLINETEEEC